MASACFSFLYSSTILLVSAFSTSSWITFLTSSTVNGFALRGFCGYSASPASTSGPKSPYLSNLLTIRIPFFFSTTGAGSGWGAVSITGTVSSTTSFFSLSWTIAVIAMPR